MLREINLETERTYLRNLTPKDADDFFNLNLDQEVLIYTGDKPFQTIEEAKNFLEQYDQYEKYGVGRLAVIEKRTNEFIGWCGLKFSPDLDEYDIGFRFNRENWNKGLATETAKKCLEFGFDNLNLKVIVGRAMKENKASIKVLEKIGMTFLKNFDFDGQEGVVYQTTRNDYEKRMSEPLVAIMLKTNRLNIRELTFADIDNVHELHSLPETDKFNTLGIPETIQTTEKILDEWLTVQKQEPRNSYVFSIDKIEDNCFIGLIALNLGKVNYRTAEVWFKIHKNFWRKGYTTEALTKILDFAFNDLKLHRIEAGCAVENIASSKVLEKVGMKQEGMKRKKLPIRGEWKDNYFYGILEEDFDKRD